MAEDDTQRPAQTQAAGAGTRQGGREARLAAALRENLRRRKAQDRARRTTAGGNSADGAGDPPSN